MPAAFQPVEEALLDFGGDVGVGLDDPVVEVVPSLRAWAISGTPSAISQVL